MPAPLFVFGDVLQIIPDTAPETYVLHVRGALSPGNARNGGLRARRREGFQGWAWGPMSDGGAGSAPVFRHLGTPGSAPERLCSRGIFTDVNVEVRCFECGVRRIWQSRGVPSMC